MYAPSSAIIEPLSANQAQLILDKCGRGSWRQYPAYSHEAARRIGASDEYIAFVSNGTMIALANVRTKYLPLVKTGVALISHGPVLLREAQYWEKDLSAALQALHLKYVKQKGLCLRIEPDVNWRGTKIDFHQIAYANGFSAMDAKGFQTFILDIEADPARLRKQLAGKWRTDLNRGEREKLHVTRSEKPEDIVCLKALLDTLAGQKGFEVPQGPDFFASVAAKVSGKERIAIHLIWKDDRIISGHIGGYSGDMAVYLLGATSDEGRNLRASYVAQWAVIEYARELGMKYYDLGGVDKIENPSVYRFKERMGGSLYTGPSPVQCYPGAVSGFVLKTAEAAYKRLKG